MKVCHITTVHPARDTRIFYKECQSLAKNGYNVSLIAPQEKTEEEGGVKIIGIGEHHKNRLNRMTAFSRLAYKKAIETDADIYHFHDPEFLPFAYRLKMRGKAVIYDSHEHFPKQLLSKPYLPHFIRRPFAYAIEKLENSICKRLDYIITAEPYVRDRFVKVNPHTIDINNYPRLSETPDPYPWEQRKRKVVYIGSISRVRGLIGMVRAIDVIDDVELLLGGNFVEPGLMEEASQLQGWKKVNYLGYLNRTDIQKALSEAKVGLVTLHPEENYVNAYPVKIFEYMAAGIPVVSSAFPVWQEIVEGNDCGICVNPMRPEEIANAISHLLNNDALAREMGRNGREAVLKKYSWETQEKKLLKVYSEIMS